MAVNINRANVGYGLSNPLQDLAPQPIVAQRAPTVQDFALIGTTWLDQSAGQDVYVLLQVAANVATWRNVSDAGVGAITTVNGGTNTNVAGAAPVVTVNVDDAPTFAGLVTGEAGLTIEAGPIALTSDTNGAGAITLDATAGGINIFASNAVAGEDINVTATGSSVNITSTEAFADAITLDASDAAGGIDLTTGGGEITIDTTDGNIQLVPGTNTVAGTSLTLNAKVGVAEFTGQTFVVPTVFTIVNSEISATSGVMVSVTSDEIFGSGPSILEVRVSGGSMGVNLDSGSFGPGAILWISFIVLT